MADIAFLQHPSPKLLIALLSRELLKKISPEAIPFKKHTQSEIVLSIEFHRHNPEMMEKIMPFFNGVKSLEIYLPRIFRRASTLP